MSWSSMPTGEAIGAYVVRKYGWRLAVTAAFLGAFAWLVWKAV